MSTKPDRLAKLARRVKVPAGAVMCVLLLLLVIGAGILFSMNPIRTTTARASESASVDASHMRNAVTISVTIDAPGYDMTSAASPMFVYLSGVSDDVSDVVVGQWFAGRCTLRVPAGAYKLTYVSPVDADGSYYYVPAAETVVIGTSRVEGYDANPTVALTATFVPISTDNLSKGRVAYQESELKKTLALPGVMGSTTETENYVDSALAALKLLGF